MPSKDHGKKRILLISGYDAASHRYWRQTLEKNLPQYDWTQIALADRYYAWRIRGNGLTLATEYREQLAKEYDCLFVTSMVDLNSLIGFVPQLSRIPIVLYCHENQFVYPQNNRPQESANRLNAQLSAIYGAMCADRVVFNSKYNRDTFLKGVSQLAKRLPDGIPKNLAKTISDKSALLAVPIESPGTKDYSGHLKDKCFELVWNHRWEFDKQPEVLFKALKQFKSLGYQFKLHVVGQSFRQVPECFDNYKQYFEQEIVSWGFQSRKEYLAILSRADIVISTALHDFQGLSMLEAISYGCLPIAPNRVAYPEYIMQSDLYSVGAEGDEFQPLCDKLEEVYNRSKGELELSNSYYAKRVAAYFTKPLIKEYLSLIESVIESN